jgi:glycosyltransferase involved in cell wall biosynthesis
MARLVAHHRRTMDGRLDLTVAVPTLNERHNIEELVPALRRTLERLGLAGEVLILDGGSRDGTREAAEGVGARAILVPGGYGEAIRVGLQQAAGEYVVTMDADLSHAPEVVARLWEVRAPLTIGIASRYVAGGSATMSRVRLVLSRVLNVWFARGLSLPVHDLSSGFRIYPASAARQLQPRARDFDILPELLVRADAAGWSIVETPFHYAPRWSGSSKARLLRLGRAYVGTFVNLWRLRYSKEGADHDEHALAAGRDR